MNRTTRQKIFFSILLLSQSAGAVLPTEAPKNRSYKIPLLAELPGLEGMAALQCSGVVVQLGRELTRHAVILTNGHCTTRTSRGEFLVNEGYSRSLISVYDTSQRAIGVRPLTVLYTTMSRTDLALIEIQPTYQDLIKRQVKVFEVARTPPQVGDKVVAITGYWRDAFESSVDYIVPELRDAGRVWNDSIALHGRDQVRPGWSGSPLIGSSGEVVGVINSYAERTRDCRPFVASCERYLDGTERVSPGKAYAQQVVQIWDCLTEGNVDLARPGCLLTGHP